MPVKGRLILLLALAAGAGCAARRTVPAAVLPPRLSAEELLARMPSVIPAGVSQKSSGTLVLHTGRYRQKARAALQLAEDGRLRADLFAMGVHLFSLVAGAERFTAYQPSEKRVLIGARNGSYLSGLLGADVSVDDFLQLLRPQIIFDSTSAARLYGVDIVDNRYVLTCKHPDRLERFWVEPGDYRISRLERYGSGGALEMSYELERPRAWDGSVPYPERAELYAAATDVRAALEFKSRTIGSGTDPDRYRLTVPARTETVYVDGYAR